MQPTEAFQTEPPKPKPGQRDSRYWYNDMRGVQRMHTSRCDRYPSIDASSPSRATASAPQNSTGFMVRITAGLSLSSESTEAGGCLWAFSQERWVRHHSEVSDHAGVAERDATYIFQHRCSHVDGGLVQAQPRRVGKRLRHCRSRPDNSHTG